MKWTNHDRLSVYGVRIVGWPHRIPQQNPSTLTTNQNKELLECLKGGTLHFVRIAHNLENVVDSTVGSPTLNSTEAVDDLFWVYEDIGPSSLLVCTGATCVLANLPTQIFDKPSTH